MRTYNEAERDIVRKLIKENLASTEIARRTGWPVGTVNSFRHREFGPREEHKSYAPRGGHEAPIAVVIANGSKCKMVNLTSTQAKLIEAILKI